MERRALLAVLLSRVERGVLLDAERALLRPLVEAEMAGGDTAQQLAERHRLALSEVLGLGTGAPWDAISERAADAPSWEALAEAVSARKAEAAAHEEHRRGMALILDLPVDADWLAVTRRVTEHRRELDAQLAARQRGDKA